MTEAKVGDKVRLVNKPVWVGAYKEGDIGTVVEMNEEGYYANNGYVLVQLDKGFKQIYSVPHGQYEVLQDVEHKGTPHDILNSANVVLSVNSAEELSSNPSAETIRSNILSIREKRSTLLMEIAALDKEEAKLVEKLKQQGFVLYESALQAPTEKKTVLYAEDIEEDMTNPENWKIGDLIECDGVPDTTPGKGYRVVSLSTEDNEVIFIDDVGDNQYRDIDSRFKFHSRPL